MTNQLGKVKMVQFFLYLYLASQVIVQNITRWYFFSSNYPQYIFLTKDYPLYWLPENIFKRYLFFFM